MYPHMPLSATSAQHTKQASSLSGGRTEVFVAAAWGEHKHVQSLLPSPPLSQPHSCTRIMPYEEWSQPRSPHPHPGEAASHRSLRIFLPILHPSCPHRCCPPPPTPLTPIPQGLAYTPTYMLNPVEPHRFYIMDLPRRGLSFSRITYHADVTQCLGGLNPPQPWYIVVAAPTGSVGQYPQQQQLVAFKVSHGMAIKFKQGTWHAGKCACCDGKISMNRGPEVCAVWCGSVRHTVEAV